MRCSAGRPKSSPSSYSSFGGGATRFDAISLRGYHGGGRYLPFWIASIRLRNMIEVLSHWRTYVPDERWMTQRGATFVLSGQGELLYSWRDRGLLGFSASMSEPLAFLELQ